MNLYVYIWFDIWVMYLFWYLVLRVSVWYNLFFSILKMGLFEKLYLFGKSEVLKKLYFVAFQIALLIFGMSFGGLGVRKLVPFNQA